MSDNQDIYFSVTLQKNISNWVASSGKSMNWLKEKANLNSSEFHLLTTNVKEMRIKTLFKIANAMDCNASDLLFKEITFPKTL